MTPEVKFPLLVVVVVVVGALVAGNGVQSCGAVPLPPTAEDCDALGKGAARFFCESLGKRPAAEQVEPAAADAASVNNQELGALLQLFELATRRQTRSPPSYELASPKTRSGGGGAGNGRRSQALDALSKLLAASGVGAELDALELSGGQSSRVVDSTGLGRWQPMRGKRTAGQWS